MKKAKYIIDAELQGFIDEIKTPEEALDTLAHLRAFILLANANDEERNKFETTIKAIEDKFELEYRE